MDNVAFNLASSGIPGVNADLTPKQMGELAQYIVDAGIPPQTSKS